MTIRATGMPGAELALVIACCMPTTAPDRLGAVRRAAARPFDADLLLALAGAHRVEGFVDEALRAAGVSLPPAMADELRANATAGAVRAIRNAGEERRVSAALAGAGIDVLSFKGATLAMLAHGTLTLKSSNDVDLLIAPRDIARAREVLTALGYAMTLLDGVTDERRVRRYLARAKATVWRNHARGVEIDLHGRPVTMLGVALGMRTPRASVALGGDEVATWVPAPLFTYLVVHGAGHGWVRLKWIADVAALLDRSPDQIESWHREAAAMGARHCSAAALLLCEQLFGVAIPAALEAEIAADRQAHRLAAVSLRLQRALPVSGQLVPSLRTMIDLLRASALSVGGPLRWPHALWLRLAIPHTATQLGVPAVVMPAFTLLWAPFRLLTRPWRLYRRGKAASTP